MTPDMSDGTRVLVDRLWPRGLRKEDAALALWPKEIGPSPELREWFGHDPARYVEFAHCYRAELARGNAILSHAADTADLMGMGAYDHSRTREEIFAGTTRTHGIHDAPPLMSH
jgi:uncharacterized protein YeaO (DUF488 family)